MIKCRCHRWMPPNRTLLNRFFEYPGEDQYISVLSVRALKLTRSYLDDRLRWAISITSQSETQRILPQFGVRQATKIAETGAAEPDVSMGTSLAHGTFLPSHQVSTHPRSTSPIFFLTVLILKPPPGGSTLGSRKRNETVIYPFRLPSRTGYNCSLLNRKKAGKLLLRKQQKRNIHSTRWYQLQSENAIYFFLCSAVLQG